MATNSMVPYSNKTGANQTSPSMPPGGGMKPNAMAVPGSPGTATQNPLTPASSAPASPLAVPGSTAPGTPPSLITNAQDGSQNALLKQLNDIYGQGVGNELMTLLGGMGGTDSAIFQQYLQSMAPEEASQRAGLNTTLGNMGVSGNSTVAADANADLTSQFNAQASGVDAQLMQTQLQDTIGIITGTEDKASQETASSGWDVFGSVMQGLGSVAGTVIGGAGAAGGFSSLFS